MKHYIGIDLGTTNSVISSFDGTETRIWKSPEQNDVTPSAIYIDKHGHRFYGRRAYEMAPISENNSATLFKRYLGTNYKYTIASTGEELTPEECSAEILRLLFGYLPQEWQEDPDTVTVITVPAAFNQMKKDATLKAAELAQIGNVALIQEPVAAVMSALKEKNIDGIFLIYDLGGGTFDISVAEHVGGQVNLLAQGGKEMCGGRDWDRLLWQQIVYPWLRQNFHLPDDADRSKEYSRLRQLSLYACEQAKIELSLRKEAYIQVDEERFNQKDLDGKDIYLDIPVLQEKLTGLISDLIHTTITVTKNTIQKAGVRKEDIQKIIFIGGPTVYPPLQHMVMKELNIREKGLANPMTAVSEGASIFAESINWKSRLHNQQDRYHRFSEQDFDINYEQRVSADSGRIAVICKKGGVFSMEAVSELDGWTSGRVKFQDRGILTLPLKKQGENIFRFYLFDGQEKPVSMTSNRLILHRVLASVNAIPSSHAIALKVLENVGGKAVPAYLVRENEQLPKRGTITLRAGRRLVAGSNDSLVFTLWEGEIVDPIDDNRYIGTYRIDGNSIPSGVIAVGADIICEYEINESGSLQLGVTIPSVGAVFPNQNFYCSTEGHIDLSDPSGYLKTAKLLLRRVLGLKSRIFDPELMVIEVLLVETCENLESEDPELVQQAVNDLLECQRNLARYRQNHIKEVRLIELNSYRSIVEKYKGEVSDTEMQKLEDIYISARRAIEHHGDAYESILQQYRRQAWVVLESSDRFLEEQFIGRILFPQNYTDQNTFHQLADEGQSYIREKNYQRLKPVISRLDKIRKPEISIDTENMFENVNVLIGTN